MFTISSFILFSFINYTTKDGLIDNEIWAIEIDEKGIIWIGTFYGGVSKFEDKTGNIWFSAENYGVYRYNGKEFTQFTFC